MKIKFQNILSVFFILFALSCSTNKPEQKQDLSDPKQYWMHLYSVLKSNQFDSQTWCEELTEKYCARGEEYLKNQYQIWHDVLIPWVEANYGGDPAKVPVRWAEDLFTIGGEGKELQNIRVTLERGRLRINEN